MTTALEARHAVFADGRDNGRLNLSENQLQCLGSGGIVVGMGVMRRGERLQRDVQRDRRIAQDPTEDGEHRWQQQARPHDGRVARIALKLAHAP